MNNKNSFKFKKKKKHHLQQTIIRSYHLRWRGTKKNKNMMSLAFLIQLPLRCSMSQRIQASKCSQSKDLIEITVDLKDLLKSIAIRRIKVGILLKVRMSALEAILKTVEIL